MSIRRSGIYITTDVRVVKLLSELGFLGLGGFLGFCCCGLGGLCWVALLVWAPRPLRLRKGRAGLLLFVVLGWVVDLVVYWCY